MNPGSTHWGPPSAHTFFLTVSLNPSNSSPWGARQSPAALGGQGTVSKETQESPLCTSCTIFHQPYVEHPGCRYLPANPRVSLVACTLRREATSRFAISHIPSSGCTRGRVLELLASTLSALAGKGIMSASHHDTCHRGFGQRGRAGIKSNTEAREAYICWSTRPLQRWTDVQPECPRGTDIPWCPLGAIAGPSVTMHTHLHHVWKPGWKELELFWHPCPPRQAQPYWAESGLPSSISFSPPDDGGCVLVASLLNKPAKRAPGKKPISPVTHLLHACCHGVARHPSCGLRAIRHSCTTVRSSVPPAMYPEVPSGALISLQGIAVAKHVSISALPSTVFIASFLLWCVSKPNMKKIKEQIVTHCKSRRAFGLSSLLWIA